MGTISKVTGLVPLLALLLFPLHSNAGPKEDYELQERCGKRADERFKMEYGNGSSSDKDSTYIFAYRNHYNAKLNKCFILITTTTIPKREDRDIMIMTNLYDVNENKDYASIVNVKQKIFGCRVLDKLCKSENEWNLLIKPYMEE